MGDPFRAHGCGSPWDAGSGHCPGAMRVSRRGPDRGEDRAHGRHPTHDPGRTELTGADGGVVLSVLSQPKRFALLVYLSFEGSGGLIRRDTVAALFWPDHDQERRDPDDARRPELGVRARSTLYFRHA